MYPLVGLVSNIVCLISSQLMLLIVLGIFFCRQFHEKSISFNFWTLYSFIGVVLPSNKNFYCRRCRLTHMANGGLCG